MSAPHDVHLSLVRTSMRTWPAECGARLAAVRQAAGWERSRLAAAVGTTPATIHRVESGAINPRDALRVAIAWALDVPVGAIWRYPDAADGEVEGGQ